MLYRKAFATPVLSVGQFYHDNMVMGGLLTFDFRDNKLNGTVGLLTIIDNNKSKRAHIHLYCFDAPPSNHNDQSKFEPNARDMHKLIGRIDVDSDDYVHVGERSYINKPVYDLYFDLDDKSIYAYAICMGQTPTFAAADDLAFKLGIYLNT